MLYGVLVKGLTIKEIKDVNPNLLSAYHPNIWVVTGCTHNEKTLSSIFLGIRCIMNERINVSPMDYSCMRTYIFYEPCDVEVTDIVVADLFYHLRIT